MVQHGVFWISSLLILNAAVILESVHQWSDKQHFPANKIPEEALNASRNVIQRKIVLYHNFFRTKVRPTASNMLLMSWHDTAAIHAQKYAERCIFLKHNALSERTVPHLGSCGQNLFASSHKAPWFTALKTWFLEYKQFIYGYPKNNLTAIGHYTQMIWATSHKVGCGVARCRGGPWGQFYNYVCHYCPGGNIDSSFQFPYKVGQKCKDCPGHCVSESLCNNPCLRRDLYGNCASLVKYTDICKRGVCNATCSCGERRIHKNFPWK